MIDMSKPFVWHEGLTVIGYDPGCPEGDCACMVTMVTHPTSGQMTVTDIKKWRHDDKEKRAEALRLFVTEHGTLEPLPTNSALRFHGPQHVDNEGAG